jgi:hypothetical protein
MSRELAIVPGRHVLTGEPVFGVVLHRTEDKSVVYIFPQSWRTRDQAKEYMRSLRMAYMFGRRDALLEGVHNEPVQSSS